MRLTKAVPKDMIFPVMDEIRKVVLTAPVKAGTIVLHNVCGLDSDVMVTRMWMPADRLNKEIGKQS